MDNYLSSRWPSGTGRPIPMPPQPPEKKDHRGLKIFLIVFGATLLLLLLLGLTFWSVRLLAGRLAQQIRPSPAASSVLPESPLPSWGLPDTEPDGWTPDRLPMTRPDPAVQLAVTEKGENVLSGQAIYRTVLPSVVSVVAERARSYSSGSGFVVTESGYILTNYHVIEGGDSIQVALLSDLTAVYDARVVGFDREFDLAVLKIAARGLTPVVLGDSDQLSVGDPVYAIGNPMGYLYGSMSDGIISALDRDSVEDNGGMGMIQTTAPLNAGNSGGPLLNDRGQVVGITSAKITGIEDDTVIEGLGLALPISDLLPFVNRILATGESWRPYIGITCQEASVNGRKGILVVTVQAGVPAQAAGLRADDFVIAANGQPVTSLMSLRRVLYRAGVDGQVTCTVLRGGLELEITFTLINNLEE